MPDRDLLKPHSFDGIQEYDNDLPRWWLAILWISVIWSGLYIGYYHIDGQPLGEAAMKIEIAAANEARLRNAQGPLDESLLRELSRDSARIAKGKEIWGGNLCATCHGPDGNGKSGANDAPGPNLRDDWWLHGSDMSAIIASITNGYQDKGMPPQKDNLSADDIISLACFVAQQNRSKMSGKPHDPERDQEQPITW